MSTQVQITDAKWFYQNKNGDDFTLLPNDFTRNLSSGIFENVKLVANIRIYTLIEVPGDVYITNESIHLEDANFDESINVGDICFFVASSSSPFIEFEVTSVTSDVIYFNIIQNTGFNLPATTGDPDQIYVTTPLTYLKYNWGLRPNNSNEDFYRSYLDDDSLSFICDSIGLKPNPTDPRDTNFVNGLKTAINSNFGDFKVRYVQDSLSPIDQFENINIAQNFEIEHTFKVQDYKQSDIQNYINQVRTSSYLGQVSLDYNSSFEFRTVETNPETAKEGTFISEGNVGFWGENFNGRPNIYSISNLSITRVSNGESVDQISSQEQTLVSFTIESSESSFVSDPTLVFTHFAMISQYENQNTSFEELFYLDDVSVTGVSTVNSNEINEARITGFTNNSIDVELLTNPGTIDLQGEQYFLSVLVSDPSQNNIVTNKVPLIITAGTYFDNFDIEGLIGTPVHHLFLRDCEDFSITGATHFSMIKAELIMTKILIPILDGEIFSIEVQTIAKSGEISEVTTELLDLTFDLINGVQEINQVITNPNVANISDGSMIHLGGGIYELIYPFRMPYDENVSVDSLPDDLYNNTLPSNGKNQDVYYIQEQGYDIHIAYKIGMLKDGRLTYYRFRTPKIQILDFETPLS